MKRTRQNPENSVRKLRGAVRLFAEPIWGDAT